MGLQFLILFYQKLICIPNIFQLIVLLIKIYHTQTFLVKTSVKEEVVFLHPHLASPFCIYQRVREVREEKTFYEIFYCQNFRTKEKVIVAPFNKGSSRSFILSKNNGKSCCVRGAL